MEEIGQTDYDKNQRNHEDVWLGKIKFVGELITNVTFKEKDLKIKIFMMRNTNNLFGTDRKEQFQL